MPCSYACSWDLGSSSWEGEHATLLVAATISLYVEGVAKATLRGVCRSARRGGGWSVPRTSCMKRTPTGQARERRKERDGRRGVTPPRYGAQPLARVGRHVPSFERSVSVASAARSSGTRSLISACHRSAQSLSGGRHARPRGSRSKSRCTSRLPARVLLGASHRVRRADEIFTEYAYFSAVFFLGVAEVTRRLRRHDHRSNWRADHGVLCASGPARRLPHSYTSVKRGIPVSWGSSRRPTVQRRRARARSRDRRWLLR